MTVSERVCGDVTILDVNGKMVFGETVGLRDKVNSLMFQQRSCLVVNLDNVAYIDSAGLAELISTHRSVAVRGGQLKLLKPSRRHLDLLAMSKLLTVFEYFDDEAQAIESFSAVAV
jgi:anti-anti-sigma factor